MLKNPPTVDYHERIWTTDRYTTNTGRDQKRLQAQAYKTQSDPESHLEQYSDETAESIKNFVQYCRSRDIFVIFHVPPVWYRQPANKPEGKTLTEADHRAFALYMELERTPNCAFTYLRNFHEIIPGVSDAELFADEVHMRKQGATIYTNWLTEQMLKNPKIVAALETPRKSEEFFVKKYAKVAWKSVGPSVRRQ